MTTAERVKSRKGVYQRDGERTLLYFTDDTADQNQVLTEVLLAAPATHDSYLYNGITYEPEWVDSETDTGLWYSTVHYRRPEVKPNHQPPPAGTARINVSAKAEQLHITVPRNPTPKSRNVPIGGTAVAYEGIGDNGKKFEGADIKMPVYSFGYEFTQTSGGATQAYLDSVGALVGKTNNATWKGFAAGSVLFEGFTGDFDTGQESTLNFQFSYSPNETNKVIGGITIAERAGWDLLDLHSEVVEDGDHLKLKYHQVDVWEVYEAGDFNVLGF